MDFMISALGAEPFRHLFGKDSDSLARMGVQRIIADENPGFPCRVSLKDAEVGEPVLLLNYEHQPAPSPYRSSHAIYVREWAAEAKPAINEVPESLRRRLLSVRAFDDRGMMIAADVIEGPRLAELIGALLADVAARYLHIHNAKRGCYAARVDRV